MLRGLQLATVVAVGAMAMVRPAEARVDIRVDLSAQTMEVASSEGTYVWPISSARSGYRTPHGSYGIQRMEVMHRSHKYHNSPMPHSLFFSGGYAIHGTYETAALGQPASHGCIRIAPENAAMLYQMVAQEGARISITGDNPAPRDYAEARRSRHVYAQARRSRVPEMEEQPDDVLGYAPQRDTTLRHWWDNPAEE